MIVGIWHCPARVPNLIALYPLESIGYDDNHRQGGAKETTKICFFYMEDHTCCF